MTNDVTISNAVRYIGVDDNDSDLFEGQYIIPNGISYNSYVTRLPFSILPMHASKPNGKPTSTPPSTDAHPTI